MTAKLSWHVQICDMIKSFFLHKNDSQFYNISIYDLIHYLWNKSHVLGWPMTISVYVSSPDHALVSILLIMQRSFALGVLSLTLLMKDSDREAITYLHFFLTQ